MVIKILFVDDESKVLEGLQRMLRSMRHDWEMAFAEGGQAALERLAQEPFDVVVSDMRMPGKDGAQLLTEVMERHPQIVRIILSGHSDQEMIMRSVGPAHQYLSKPCDAETLKKTVTRACALRDLLTSEKLRLLVSQMQALPSLPSLYLQLTKELQSPEASINRVGEIIAQDMGMTAKILQMVNSAFFGLRRQVSCPTEAASFIGLDRVRALVLSVHVFSQFNGAELPDNFLPQLWAHCLLVAKFSELIAKAEHQERRVIDEAFTAGLLHDVGKLVLAANQPKPYREMLALAESERLTADAAERQVFGASHTEVGAYLLGLWGLPHSLVETVAFHQAPSQCAVDGFGPLTAVHVANLLEDERHQAERPRASSSMDLDHLTKLGLLDRLPVWRQACESLESEAVGSRQ